MDKTTLDSTDKTIYIILFFCFAFVGLFVFFLGDFDKNSSDMCSFHKELYETEFDSAVVTVHFVDSPNHAMQTVRIRQKK
jgi:cytochrome oxidase Cu insertion factor (SCO1/SenC/PrrC family)